MSRFSFVESYHCAFGVKRLCRILGISRSGFCRWRKAAAARAARRVADARLARRIRAIHAESGARYGSPRVHAGLRACGDQVNRKRVERIMRQHRIVGRHHHGRRCRTTQSDPAAARLPDLIGRDFAIGRADQRWCGDMTYLPVGDGRWMYLATVLDIGTRRLVGYSMAEHMRADLVIDALTAAIQARGGNVAGVVFHSDHGAQYTSAAFATACAAAGIRQSMGTIGSSADNSLAEAFFATLKREILPPHGWSNTRQARLDVFRWLSFYNTRRRHSALGHLSPVEYETRSPMLAAAA
jgi:transposase InsO family protein